MFGREANGWTPSRIRGNKVCFPSILFSAVRTPPRFHIEMSRIGCQKSGMTIKYTCTITSNFASVALFLLLMLKAAVANLTLSLHLVAIFKLYGGGSQHA
jgi:hypothetical protein